MGPPGPPWMGKHWTGAVGVGLIVGVMVENVVVVPHPIYFVPARLIVVCMPTISSPHWQNVLTVGVGPSVYVPLAKLVTYS